MKMEVQLRVLTLNCCSRLVIRGIPGISADRRARMVAIATEVAAGNYDFVVLQEVWSYHDYKMIAQKTEDVMPHSHYFHSGAIGAGLCVLSKGIIVDTFFQVWSLNGYAHKIQHGDWYGGKGAGLCRIHYLGLKINLYTAHLHAVYNHKHDEYLAHRVFQAFEFSQFVANTSHDSDLVIVGGDFNAEPADIPYRLICHNSVLCDTFSECEKKKDNVGATNETVRNTYTPKSVLKQSPHGRRIDYILYGHAKGTEVKVLSCDSPLDKVPGQDFSYSDHETVVATLNVSKTQIAKAIEPNIPERVRVLEETMEVMEKALHRVAWDRKIYLIAFGILFLLLFGTVQFEMPFGLQSLLGVLRIFFSMATVFCVLMGTVWNRTEKNALLSVLKSAAILLRSLRTEKNIPALYPGDQVLPNFEGVYHQ